MNFVNFWTLVEVEAKSSSSQGLNPGSSLSLTDQASIQWSDDGRMCSTIGKDFSVVFDICFEILQDLVSFLKSKCHFSWQAQCLVVQVLLLWRAAVFEAGRHLPLKHFLAFHH